ncbi:Hsp70 protein that interacts with Zuo1p [Friedmanniomyces endolithicus]|uniref:Hsp70 protein that interacts with Zuo1p n=1 Tax=Rachicladosporium monterosium TaxID=1507873 RepID=A0ABR0LC06_9PEZI|nr:Hsp70 protein that interacts with Zuo1p [Friedmanniomyces endolithicus]KAK5146010.1 Hsp70 protein that interacts with Zuo1p [Rachicladosporium monterosium]
MSSDSAIDDTQYPQRTAIGLSFGNSYSSIAHTADGKTEVIANEEGDRQIPSILSYVSGEEFQGAQAKVQLVRNPRNTIAYFRDLLGRKFKDVDPSPCHASAHPVESDGEGVAFVVQEKAAGAAIQASLISGFEVEEIGSSTEAVVTVTPHLQHAIGLVTGEDGFAVIVPAETPAPVRRTAQVVVKQGGDVLVRLAEGVREISVRKEDKSMTNGNGKKNDEDEDDEDDEDDEPEEVREKVWKAGKVLAEAGIRGVKKGGKVEVQVNVAADLSVTVVCREVGAKGGVRGTVPAGKAEQNGSA